MFDPHHFRRESPLADDHERHFAPRRRSRAWLAWLLAAAIAAALLRWLAAGSAHR
jgi:hypothetical protein